ncbi:Hypothetical Protein FCC1311_113172 [Hondaea fermentalgiana]|uniref:TIR domain-containing protein n=1 Tax=Hondaea fermentalgiana TaxID=2315210 RepID=A0A2R5H3T9_9STRA|nr:Hypothetical Protein FCC1311_113172 [Hondaea fermentalgiana]|eukprot:GBG35094.1 Hypothetical Protein FCC1311_113172 [Hondaea fermentalgiana]
MARLLRGDLQQPRSLRDLVAEAAHDLERVQPKRCPNAAHVSQKSLPRRVSRRLVRISGIYQHLTHDWDENGANHEVVSSVNAKLRHANRVTWFVEDRHSCDIVQQITQGIGNSCNVVVYITDRCMDMRQSDNEELIKNDFLAVTLVRPG